MTGPNRLLLLGGAAAALWVAPTAAAPTGWEIHETERFCYAWHGASDAGGTEIGIAVDARNRTTIILTNRAWRLEDGKRYALASRIGDGSGPVRARGLKIRSDPDVVALIVEIDDPDFARRIGAAPALHVRTSGPDPVEALVAEAMIRGAAPAVAEAGRCAGRKEELRLARMRLDHQERFRSDPPAIWIRGGSRN